MTTKNGKQKRKNVPEQRMAVALAVFLSVSFLTGCGRRVSEAENVSAVEKASETEEAILEPDSESEVAKDITAEVATDTTAEVATDTTESKPVLTFGDERTEEYLPLLEGKRVALFSNQTGIVGNRILNRKDGQEDDLLHFGVNPDGSQVQYGEHILDLLLENDVNVTAVFSPEHGFRGTEDAGASVSDSVDEKTGVPILSLYAGDSHYPSDEDMSRFDTLVVDLQDVGLRYYTYHILLYYLMDACAAHEKEILILDRPNPNGFYVDGPILQDAFRSGVGQLPLPVVYGMTWGELAQMINGEGWLSAGRNAADVTVIECLGYSHEDKVPLVTAPSPNLKNMRAVYLYASTCFFENTLVSVGRGTEDPFTVYGSPYLDGVDGYDYYFTPQSMSGAEDPPFRGERCAGRNLGAISAQHIWEEQIDLSYLIDAYRSFEQLGKQDSFFGKPDGNGVYWVDKLFGTDSVRKMIMEGRSAQEIKASWQPEIEAFKQQRRPYLLY